MDLVIKINDFIEKSRVYLKPGEQPPEGASIVRGKRGGMYYELGAKGTVTSKNEVVLNIKGTKELEGKLVELSEKHGGAWVFSVTPFTHEVSFRRFSNPSSVPDEYFDLTRSKADDRHPRGRIGYKGKIVPFTEAAFLREQAKGYTKD